VKKIFLSILCILSLAAATPTQAASWHHLIQSSSLLSNIRPFARFYAWWNKDKIHAAQIEAQQNKIKINEQEIADLKHDIANRDKTIDSLSKLSIERAGKIIDLHEAFKKISSDFGNAIQPFIIQGNKTNEALEKQVQKREHEFGEISTQFTALEKEKIALEVRTREDKRNQEIKIGEISAQIAKVEKETIALKEKTRQLNAKLNKERQRQITNQPNECGAELGDLENNNVIEGDLWIARSPTCGTYAYGMDLPDELSLSDNQWVLAVNAKSKESDNWAINGHPRLQKQDFPTHLPYKWLIDKKEEQILEFPLNKKIFRLRLCQLKHGPEKHPFEKVLLAVKNDFVEKPNCHASVTLELLNKGILNINNGKYSHGPAGFQN
jgi:hypothetical protein